MTKFTKDNQPVERVFAPDEIERVWELFFGKKYSLNRIAREYGVDYRRIAAIIDTESARRWKMNHPHETNREHLLVE